VATAAILVFFVVFFNAFQGVREVDRNLIANARILGANNRRLTTEIIIPSALTWIIASLHISFGLALVGAVVGELFGATQGVGELIYSAEHNFDANGVFAGMLLLAAMALIAEALITALENRLISWRPNPVGTDIKV
jgi:NitT/TauT family transport system permease protein